MNAGYASTTDGLAVQSTIAALVSSSAARRLASPSGLIRPRAAPSAAFQFARSTPAGETTNRRLLASATTRTSKPRESR